MTDARPLRSLLYMPASNARAMAKARTLDCDAVCLDLEDAVAPEAKADARAALVAEAQAGGFGHRLLVARINALSTPWGADDIAALGSAPVDAVLAPKVDDAADVLALSQAMDAAGFDTRVALWVMIETPRAVLVADQLARIADFFSFGTNDLTQMTFGFSRDDVEAKMMPAYVERGLLPGDPFHSIDAEGVGELVRIGVERGRSVKHRLAIGVCGEHGGDPISIGFFLDAGVDYVSCSPYRVPIARLAAASGAGVNVSKQNLLRLGAAPAQVQVLEADSLAWLRRPAAGSFDLILLDPPYALRWGDALRAAAAAHLRPDGWLYQEDQAPFDPERQRAEGWDTWRQGRAGQVHFQLLRRSNSPSSDYTSGSQSRSPS